MSSSAGSITAIAKGKIAGTYSGVGSGTVTVPEEVVDGETIPEHEVPFSVDGTFTGENDVVVFSEGDFEGFVDAGSDATLRIIGEQSGTVFADDNADVYANLVSGTVTSNGGASVASGTDITSNITAWQNLSAVAIGNISGALTVTNQGELEAVALGDFSGTALNLNGNANLVVGQSFTGSVTTRSAATANGSATVLAMHGFDGTVDADNYVDLTVLGHVNGSVTGGKSSGSTGHVNVVATLDGSGTGGDINGNIESHYGDVTAVSGGDVNGTIHAGSASDATGGDAEVSAGGSVSESVTAYHNATVTAFEGITGDVTAITGGASLTTGRAITGVTVTAGTDAEIIALQTSSVDVTAGGNINLLLATPGTGVHTTGTLNAAGGNINANVIGGWNVDSATAANSINGFVLGGVTVQNNLTAGENVELLASGAMDLGTVNAGGDIGLSTAGLIHVQAIDSTRGSVSVFTGSTLTVLTDIDAFIDVDLGIIGPFMAQSVTAQTGDINLLTQSTTLSNLDAAGDIRVAAGEIGPANYIAGEDMTLVGIDAISTATGTISAGGNLSMVTGGSIALSNTAQAETIRTIYAGGTIESVQARGDITGEYDSAEIGQIAAGGLVTVTFVDASVTPIENSPYVLGYELPDEQGDAQGFPGDRSGVSDALVLIESLLRSLDESLAWSSPSQMDNRLSR